MKNNKIIFHIDFDSYFASAHRSINPALKNKPIAIAHNHSAAICSSVSYELKRKKVKVGQPKYMVERIEPKTIFIEPDFNLYISLSNQVFEYISRVYTKNIEVYSIDECWLDVSNLVGNKNPLPLAFEIQQAILDFFNLPVSIGISHTKWMAKMATDINKPFGLTYIDTFEDVVKFIHSLPVKDYFGIGESTSKKLQKLNINNVGDLASKNPNDVELYKIFRDRTSSYILDANGEGNDKLDYKHNDLKGIGNEVTFAGLELDTRADIYQILKNLSFKVAKRAQNRNMLAKTVSIVIRNTNGNWFSKQNVLNYATNDENKIYDFAVNLFEKSWNENPIKGIGVRLNNLENEFDSFKQLTIFENSDDTKECKINNIIKDVNIKLKQKALKTGYQYSREKVRKNIQSRYIQDDLVRKGE
ncbi:Y-family DNA polymerase [Mycoplasmopsis felifaucium]|uniref:Y-family DNA polymerase n=1 Tax=Mycoplasmopsis felifaucium TaxID=35768 RepID=UPI000487474C|nr:DNA polymerase IV [Mycoplasmopsis felifaucium]